MRSPSARGLRVGSLIASFIHYGLWHEPAPPHNYYQDTSRKFDNIGPHDHSASDQAIGNDQKAVWDNRQKRPYNT